MNEYYLTPDLYIALYEEYFRPCQHQQQDLLHQSLLPPVGWKTLRETILSPL